MRNSYFIAFFLLFTASLQVEAQKQSTDAKLESKIGALIEGFHGKVGVYVENLRTGKTAAINADSLFPTASQVKVSILTGIMDKIRTGALDYHQVLVYRDSLHYAGVDILGSFKDGEKIELSKVMMLMLTMSDNTASLWLQGLAGGGTRINQLLDSLGFKTYRVNSRTPGREAIRNIYGWGVSTPREMARIFRMIYEGKIFSPAVSERMLRLLGRDYWDEYALSQIPPSVFAACKGGAVDQSRSESVLVCAPHGTYVFSIQTKDLTDTTWQNTNEGWVLARKLSHLLWDYFEPDFGRGPDPKSGWHPSTSAEGKVDW